MPLTMYEAAFPPVIRALENLAAILGKAAEFCAEKKVEPSVLLNYRLAPDMFPLTRQVQIVTDQAKGMASRLAGVDVPSYPDTEGTIDELRSRLAKTIAYVKSFTPGQLEGSESREIVLKFGVNEFKFNGRDYLFNFVYPNLYFHTTTAYDILRHAGLGLGKRDFIGAV